jgi:hypothetical protein
MDRPRSPAEYTYGLMDYRFQSNLLVTSLFFLIKKYLHMSFHFRPCLLCKNFQDFLSHRILRHMHEVLNIDENKN